MRLHDAFFFISQLEVESKREQRWYPLVSLLHAIFLQVRYVESDDGARRCGLALATRQKTPLNAS
jgi:hypothetical protein